MATTTISGSTIRNARATIYGGGNSSNNKINPLTTDSIDINRNILAVAAPRTGVESVLKGSAVTITSITDSGGYCLVTKSSHGFSVGQKIVVYGTDVTGYNTTHNVTAVPSSSTFKTDVVYTADTTTHGSYKPFSGDFQVMTKGRYIGKVIGQYVAGSASSIMRSPSADYNRVPYNPARGNRRYHITSWNYATGAATKGANAGDLVKYRDITGNNDNLAFEAFPTRAVPGELTYNVGLKGGPVMADYSQKNG